MRGSTITMVAAALMLCAAAMPGQFPHNVTANTAVAADQPLRMTGTLLSVEYRLNHPGANCGYHFDLTVAVVSRGQQILHVYDMSVRQRDLVALAGREVEIVVVAGGFVESIHAADRTADSDVVLSDLSTIKHC